MNNDPILARMKSLFISSGVIMQSPSLNHHNPLRIWVWCDDGG